jgi:hypothetical protein
MEEEEEQQEEVQQAGEEEGQDIEMVVETEEENDARGQDIREEVAGRYNEPKKGENSGTAERKELKGVQRKPRHSGEIEVPKNMESATFAEIIEEECYRFDSFLGVRVARERGKEKKIIATFGNTIDMHEACNVNFGDEQERKFLIPTEQVLQQQDLGRQVIIRDIPLAVSEGAIKTLIRKFGEIEKILFRTVEMWQTAIVTFQEEEPAKILADQWSIPFGKEHLRILPSVGEKDELNRRSRYIAKLAGLPAGTTAYDLEDIKRHLKGKTMYIPRTTNYFRERYAYVAFEEENDLQQAMGQEFQIGRTTVRLVPQYEKLCYKCGQDGHIAFHCGEVRVQQDKERAQARFIAVQSRFRKGPEREAPITYAEVLRKRSRSRSVARQSQGRGEDRLETRVTRIEAKLEKLGKYVEKLCKVLVPEIIEEEQTEQETQEQMEEEEGNDHYEDAEEEWNENQRVAERRYTENNRAIEERQTRIEQQMDSIYQRISELIDQGKGAMEKGQENRQ